MWQSTTRSLLFLVLVMAQTSQAIYTLRQTLSDDTTLDLGRSVALEVESGYMVVGSLSQLAQIYKYDSRHDEKWKLHQQLQSDAPTDDKFGWSVAIDGRYMAIGAPFALNSQGVQRGAVYIYRKSTLRHNWELQQTIYGDETHGEEFGHAVAMHNQHLIVSDRRHNEISDSAGRASVYRRERRSRTYTLQNNLVASDAANGDLYGYSVSIYGHFAAVGAIADDDGASSTGAVYVYRNQGGNWEFLIKLLPPIPQILKSYGESLSIYGTTIAIGALRHDGTQDNEGAIYVYDLEDGSFTLTSELLAPSPSSNDQLGRSVVIRDQTVVAGAWKDDVGSVADAGSSYVYLKKNGVWTFEEQLLLDPPTTLDEYGGSLALGCDGTLLVGAPSRFSEMGAVSIYQDNRVSSFQRWKCTRLRLRRNKA
ncbi:hypothetical protein FisN_26Hh097 [Fistulifera solaris]|uniref:Uncharacterized protein n=1 Tax=Fistulifera solaris TaxID=1519565 RepID=A0A1Z5JXP6_FISSO|nr:hypothetical protein FisN_26Hh097 [Fistulifera solaris]|eukprot:GAX18797.1 hypothetical protein FisN_26Hh097 [Fistulifera solaris]